MQTGVELESALQRDFQPGFVLSYDMARDTLFKHIYGHDDSLTCIYTGWTLYMDPKRDPTTTVYRNGQASGLNTEHTYPRNKGAEEGKKGFSDMHHLYPARVDVNEQRSNYPYQEIDDADTKIWYYQNIASNTKPRSQVERYSEWNNNMFEPREDSKGNIARSLFYFYTVYRQDALAADAFFFERQRKFLCEWHYLDPVDSMEWERTFRIAAYQDGKPNPFVLDCSLAARTYCKNTGGSCPEITSAIPDLGAPFFKVAPNPVQNEIALEWLDDQSSSGHFQVRLFDVLGRQLAVLFEGPLVSAGTGSKLFLPVPEKLKTHTGMWYLQVQQKDGFNTRNRMVKLLHFPER